MITLRCNLEHGFMLESYGFENEDSTPADTADVIKHGFFVSPSDVRFLIESLELGEKASAKHKGILIERLKKK